jgi:hypothetical protein
MHKNIETSVTWYIKLLKNFAKAGLDKDKIKFDDLVEKYGSLVNLGHVPFSNPEKILGYVEPLEAARKKIGEIVPEVDTGEDLLEGVVVAEVAGDVEVEDDLFGDEMESAASTVEEEVEVMNYVDSLAESEREEMSAIFADDKEITEDAPDPISQIGKSGEALDAHVLVQKSREMMIEALAMTPPTVYERRVPRGRNPYKRA